MSDKLDEAMQTATVFGILIVVIFLGWLIISLSTKLLGLVFIGLGILVFTTMFGVFKSYQTAEFTKSLTFIGIALLIIGGLLLIF